ncbi:MAG: hypothetical protein LiPW30_439 [Parcubacteria group bacterium LiPW_30]|nr:MAG: hypothetical protein LiPW30_439 [Parcubacteria group bacterium LiPW_30]
MKSILTHLNGALQRLEERPYLANSMFPAEMDNFWKGEKLLSAEIQIPRLEKYLESEEGQIATNLFKQVWELSSTINWCRPEKEGWLHWRVFLYRGEPRSGLNRAEIIWFGGNGLEMYFAERGSHNYQTKPTTARELVTRVAFNDSNWDQAGISRPEQIVPYIRLKTLDLVRYLNR